SLAPSRAQKAPLLISCHPPLSPLTLPQLKTQALLAKAVDLLARRCLNERHREQAHSYRICGFRISIACPENLWEGALLAKAVDLLARRCLNERHREQAHSCRICGFRISIACPENLWEGALLAKAVGQSIRLCLD
ncbi:hypothetical protein ACIPL1_25610, partial [Pseudomonas sp. NPDC090202]|uniref:hypothetical protein n=1 Tax=unclassified Pseudomonas TaxID=196821 RepID=UPI0038097329